MSQGFCRRNVYDVVVVLPSTRRQVYEGQTYNIVERFVLDDLSEKGYLMETPTRRSPGGWTVTSYDDQHIVERAIQSGGVMVSLDGFWDLRGPFKRSYIEENLIMYGFFDHHFYLQLDPGKKDPRRPELWKTISARQREMQLTNLLFRDRNQ